MKPTIAILVLAILTGQSKTAEAQLLPGEDTPTWVWAVGAGSITLAGLLYRNHRNSKIPKVDYFEKVRQVAYIATDQELAQMKYLTTKQKIDHYLQEFWQKRDPSPGIETNETRDEFERRVEHANQQFGSVLTEGWRSHRGRIHIIYGPPDEIERMPLMGFTFDGTTVISKVEMWLYHHPYQDSADSIFDSVEVGKMKFIFGDRDGHGEYTQLYSSVPGEISDPRAFALMSPRFR